MQAHAKAAAHQGEPKPPSLKAHKKLGPPWGASTKATLTGLFMHTRINYSSISLHYAVALTRVPVAISAAEEDTPALHERV